MTTKTEENTKIENWISIYTDPETGEVTETPIEEKPEEKTLAEEPKEEKIENKKDFSTFWERLGEIQSETPEIKKNWYNKHRDYHYPLLDDILKAYKPLLSKYKLVLINKLETEKSLLTTYIKDSLSSEDFSTNYKITIWKDQDMGSSLTYGRRYNAGLLLNIATEEDQDAAEVQAEEKNAAAWYYQPKTPTKAAPAKKPAAKGGITASVKQIEMIKDIFPKYQKAKGEKALTMEKMLATLWKAKLEELTIKQASETITKLQKAIW